MSFGKSLDSDYITKLAHEAAAHGDIAFIEKLVSDDKEWLFCKSQEAGWSLLHTAAANDRADVADHLIGAGLAVDYQGNVGESPLHVCAIAGSKATASVLINHGANSDCRDHESWSPLHYAARFGDVEILEFFLGILAQRTSTPDKVSEQQSSRLGSTFPKTKEGWTPLHVAARFGQLEVISFLCRFVDIEQVKQVDNLGRTALHLACQHGNVAAVHELLLNKLDINAQTEDGETAAHISLRFGQSQAFVMLLMNDGMDLQISDDTGETLLHYAARLPTGSAADMLCCRGAIVDAKDANGLTPLHVAARHGSLAAIRSLLEHGASLEEERDAQGKGWLALLQSSFLDLMRSWEDDSSSTATSASDAVTEPGAAVPVQVGRRGGHGAACGSHGDSDGQVGAASARGGSAGGEGGHARKRHHWQKEYLALARYIGYHLQKPRDRCGHLAVLQTRSP